LGAGPAGAGLDFQSGGHRCDLLQVPVPAWAGDGQAEDGEQVQQAEHDSDGGGGVTDG